MTSIGGRRASQELLVGAFGFYLVARHNVCSAQLQMREDTYRIGENDAAVIEDLLKFAAASSPRPAARYA